jgi:hypothetical protein
VNLRTLEEAFLEDLYDERRKIRVELPKYGFVLYVAPTSHPKSIWHVHLSSEAVAEVYTKSPLSVCDINRLAKIIHIRNVSSAATRQNVQDVRIVHHVEEARSMMIEHLIAWLGQNFGAESKQSAEQCARNALEMARGQTALQSALAQAERARRWFPTFYDALNREVARVGA